MTSTQSDIELSYSVSNEFFRLWLDENMHYTSAVFAGPDESLEVAQERKANILYDFSGCDAGKTILDIDFDEHHVFADDLRDSGIGVVFLKNPAPATSGRTKDQE